MSDKLNLLTSNIIRFVAGERPTADKFNAMNLYYTRAVDNICRAIGDMHDRSVDSPLSPSWNPFELDLEGRPLDIVNLARLIGPASNLNPKMFGTENKTIRERFSKDFIDANREISLKYTPSSNNLFLSRMIGENVDETFPVNSSYTFINDKTFILSDEVQLVEGEELQVLYTSNGGIDTHGGINYLGAGFNTIPDPNEATGLTSTEIAELRDDQYYSYKITLNQRIIKAQQSGSHNLDSSSIYQRLDEYNNNVTYSLPEWWESKFNLTGQETTPSTITPGLVYLKNINTGEIYLTAEYATNDLGYLYVRNATLCLDDEHRLILAGTDITTSIDDLRNKMFNHRHDGSFGEPFIRIQDLIGKYVTGEFGPSSIPGNEFPMYLHRKGYQVDDNARNGNNAMLGDIFMGNPLFSSTGEIESKLLNSHKIIFGSEESYIAKALGILLISNMYEGGDESRGNIVVRSSNEIQLNSRVNKMMGSASNILEAENNYIESTNNTRINSDNETHLQIDNDDVIVLKKNSEDTSSEDGEVNSFNSRTGSKERTWNSNNRSVFIKSADLEKKDFVIIDFEPSTNSKVVAPTGVLTQRNIPDGQTTDNFLFVTNFASIYTNGEKTSDIAKVYSDSKGRSFTQVEIPYEKFILNYYKKVTKSFDDLNVENYGVWDQQFEFEGGGDELSDYNNTRWLGVNESLSAREGVDFCFGGVNYARQGNKDGTEYLAVPKYSRSLTHRFEEYNSGFEWNKDVYSKILLEPGANWSSRNEIVSGVEYNYVEIPLIQNFTLFGNTELLTRGDGIVGDFFQELLEEVKYTWGVRVLYNSDSGEKISWLVGPPYGSYENLEAGVHYDYDWIKGDNNEFDLELKINPRHLFKASAQEAIDEKDNYTFEIFWRPYNYTRPSLQPTDICITVRRVTASDGSDGSWQNTDFSYTLYSGDYEENDYDAYIDQARENVDQRVPVGADINFLVETRSLHNVDYKKYCPTSFGVLNGDYHPSPSKGPELQSFQIHTGEEGKYCRAASVGGSKQSIAIARNVEFEEGVSSKEFIINTSGGNKSKVDATFLFEEYFMGVIHWDNAHDEEIISYRRGINCLEKPNFLLHYVGVDDLTTFSLDFNGSNAMLDCEIEDSYLRNKIINLSTAINKRFAVDVWKENYLNKDSYVRGGSLYRDELVSKWWRYYGRDSEVKSKLNTQKNWVNIQKPSGGNDHWVYFANGEGRVYYNSARDNWTAYLFQSMFVGAWKAGDDAERMPYTFYRPGTRSWIPYMRDIYFDVKMKVKETFDSKLNHLSISINCDYIIKYHSLKVHEDDAIEAPKLWSKKGIMEIGVDSPFINKQRTDSSSHGN